MKVEGGHGGDDGDGVVVVVVVVVVVIVVVVVVARMVRWWQDGKGRFVRLILVHRKMRRILSEEDAGMNRWTSRDPAVEYKVEVICFWIWI